MAGLPLPSASNLQPMGRTAPRSNIYEGREVSIGRIQGQFSGGPAVSGAVGAGLQGLAGGLDKWFSVLEDQEKQKQTFDALEQINQARTRQREMLDKMAQMKGEAGANAPFMMEEFYKKERQHFESVAKGDFQKMIYTRFLDSEENQGLDRAMGHRQTQLEAYKKQVWDGQEALAMSDIEQDPGQLSNKLAELAEADTYLHPGMAPELRKARAAARGEKGLDLSVATLIQNGELDKAEELVKRWSADGAGFSPPLAGTPRVSSPYGPRQAPQTSKGRGSANHQGVDYAVPVGTPVMSVGPGKVSYVGDTGGGYGLQVKIDHGDGRVSWYNHLSSSQGLKKGDTVDQGQVIALSGNSGKSTGPHLDFKLWEGGEFVDPQKALGRMTGGTIAPAQKKKYMDLIEKERVKLQVKGLTAEVGQSFETAPRVDALNTVKKGYDELAKISDPERRQEALNMYQQEVRFQDIRVNAADSTALEGFFTMADQMGWSPEKQLEMIKEVPGLSRETKDKLTKSLVAGLANKTTVENDLATQDLMVMIDDRRRAGESVTETEIRALANQAGATTTQVTKLIKYNREGGLAGSNAFASNVKELFNELSGDPKAKMPPGFVNMVFSKMDAGASGRDAERQAVMRVMRTMTPGESDTGFFFGTDETSIQAESAGRLELWTPDVTKAEREGIDAALQSYGLATSKRNRALWKKSELLGLPLSKTELAELERL